MLRLKLAEWNGHSQSTAASGNPYLDIGKRPQVPQKARGPALRFSFTTG
jgi:hypothetical protein